MNTVLLRKGSSGLAGTVINARHHAQNLLPLIQHLVSQLGSLDFKTWHQGHNVHVFETKDGRKFVLRAWSQTGIGYLGIRLMLRVSRSNEIFLSCLKAAAARREINAFVDLMETLACPQPNHDSISEGANE